MGNGAKYRGPKGAAPTPPDSCLACPLGPRPPKPLLRLGPGSLCGPRGAAGNLCAPTAPARPPGSSVSHPHPRLSSGVAPGAEHSWEVRRRMQTQQERWPRSCADRSCQHGRRTPQPQPGGAPTRLLHANAHGWCGRDPQIYAGNVCEPRHNATTEQTHTQTCVNTCLYTHTAPSHPQTHTHVCPRAELPQTDAQTPRSLR